MGTELVDRHIRDDWTRQRSIVEFIASQPGGRYLIADDGELLRGVRFRGDGANTQSLVMRSKSGTIRKIDATHRWKKLMRYSSINFD